MTVAMRFRALDGSQPKYASLAGDKVQLFNTNALTAPSEVVGIVEGEIDAVSATLAGLPTVGVPGTQSWQDHWYPLFAGYKAVYVLADGDAPGREFANKLGARMNNVKVVHYPDGEDTNSILATEGAEELQKYWTHKGEP